MSPKKQKAVSAVLLFACIFSFFSIGKCEASYTQSFASQENLEESNAKINKDTKISSRIYELLFGKRKDEQLYLIPGGEVFGVRINEEYPTVNNAKESSPLKRGDKIISVSGIKINSSSDVTAILKDCRGEPIKIEILRANEKMTLTVTPKLEDGEYRLGVSLRSASSGIGTVTFIEPETLVFGGLGHGVCEQESGNLAEMKDGEVCGVILGGIARGEAGRPGELSGILNRKTYGAIYKNSECGVFGQFENYDLKDRIPIPVGNKSTLKIGEAEIISTVKSGKTTRYKIEITEINLNSNTSKSFKIKVTDPTLITLTGGIVRGMSGSPIIQDGKLVGAVTHVMVANPTEGYGIFIENMLNAAENTVPKAA